MKIPTYDMKIKKIATFLPGYILFYHYNAGSEEPSITGLFSTEIVWLLS
jgi:hypothetical protein